MEGKPISDRPLHRLARDRVTVESIQADQLRGSDIVILDVRDGLYDDYGWNPETTAEVLDLSLPYWPGIPLEPGLAALRHWTGDVDIEELESTAKELAADHDEKNLGELGRKAAALVKVRTIRGDLIDAYPTLATTWNDVCERMTTALDLGSSVPMLLGKRKGRGWRQTQRIAADSFDDLSSSVESVALAEHLASVGEIAGRLGRAVGLADDLVLAVEIAGRFHDLGKADPRFQRWLNPRGSDTSPVAKSGAPQWRWRTDRVASGWPDRGRHEALSARLIDQWLEEHPGPPWDPDLVLHLVITHHGFGRPLVAPVADLTSVAVTTEVQGRVVSVSGDLSVADWDQPARFRRLCERHGYWGLALLEAIVRQADHLASGQVLRSEVEVA